MPHRPLSLPPYHPEPWEKALDTQLARTGLLLRSAIMAPNHSQTQGHCGDPPLHSLLTPILLHAETPQNVPSSCLQPVYIQVVQPPYLKCLDLKGFGFQVIFSPSHPALGLWDVFTDSHHVTPGHWGQQQRDLSHQRPGFGSVFPSLTFPDLPLKGPSIPANQSLLLSPKN